MPSYSSRNLLEQNPNTTSRDGFKPSQKGVTVKPSCASKSNCLVSPGNSRGAFELVAAICRKEIPTFFGTYPFSLRDGKMVGEPFISSPSQLDIPIGDLENLWKCTVPSHTISTTCIWSGLHPDTLKSIRDLSWRLTGVPFRLHIWEFAHVVIMWLICFSGPAGFRIWKTERKGRTRQITFNFS